MDLSNVWPGWIAESTPIGRGSYGTVYRCYTDTDEVRKYSAVKVISVPQEGYELLNPEWSAMTEEQTEEYYKEIVDEFLNEIELLESLRGSKNIVDIEDYSVIKKENGVGWDIYIRMELLTDFGTYFSQHEMNAASAVKLGLDICSALKTCREKKIIHRDIKPENIFADVGGSFKLGDFGVARQMEKTEASMSRKGTYNYMAPEVFYSKKYDSRADIYSTGIVMYKMLNNNRLPFLDREKQIILHSEREDAFNRRISGEEIPPIPGVDENLNNVILRACAYKAEDRFNSIEDFESALKAVQTGGKFRFNKVKHWAFNHKWQSVVAAVLVLSIISGTVFGVLFRNKNKQPGEKNVDSITQGDYVKEEKANIDFALCGSSHITNHAVQGLRLFYDEKGLYLIDEKEKEQTTIVKDVQISSAALYKESVVFSQETDKNDESGSNPCSVLKYDIKSKTTDIIVENADSAEVIYFNDKVLHYVQYNTVQKEFELKESELNNENNNDGAVLATLGSAHYRSPVYYDDKLIYLPDISSYDDQDGELCVYDINSKKSSKIAENVCVYHNVRLYDGKVYYVTADGLEICNLDGSDTKKITLNYLDKNNILAVGKEIIYYCKYYTKDGKELTKEDLADNVQPEKSEFFLYNISDDNNQDIGDKDRFENLLEIDGNLYHTVYVNEKLRLYKINNNGKKSVPLLADIDAEYELISVDTEGVFYTDSADNTFHYSEFKQPETMDELLEDNESKTTKAEESEKTTVTDESKQDDDKGKNTADYTVSGTITDAMNGRAVSGATIKVRSGSDSKSGSYYNGVSAVTNSNGKFTLQLPDGKYTIEASNSGYIKGYTNITVNGADISDKNLSISPELNPGSGEMRIVLNWGSRHSDLDSHLIIDGENEVYFNNDWYHQDRSDEVHLDVDDTAYYGPETITIKNPSAHTYYYFVHQYSDETTPLSESGAQVTVYCSNGTSQSFYVPSSGSGEIWNVLKIQNGRVVSVNKVSDDIVF